MTAALRIYQPDAETPPVRLPRRHGPGFGCVLWDGTLYTLTPSQGAVVRVLWRAARRGVPDVRQEYLLGAAGSDGRRLAHVFRDHPAWGALIISGPARGTFRLNLDGGAKE